MDKPLLNHPYLAFSPDTPEDAARRRFLEHFGYPPQEVHLIRAPSDWGRYVVQRLNRSDPQASGNVHPEGCHDAG